MQIEQRLNDLGIALPQVAGPIGNYVHAKRVGNLLYLSGKGPPEIGGRMPAPSLAPACRSKTAIGMPAGLGWC